MLRNKRVIALVNDKAWWLTGGISVTSCIAAYQPKGASSLESSYINIANPGVYNTVLGIAPTFDTEVGWMFLTASSQYLKTLITPSNGWSAFIRYSNHVHTNNACLFAGVVTGVKYFGVQKGSAAQYYFENQNYLLISETLPSSGIVGIAGQQGYFNGAAKGGKIGETGGAYGTINIAASYSPSGYCTEYVQAFAIYNTILTDLQVAALTNAMSLL